MSVVLLIRFEFFVSLTISFHFEMSFRPPSCYEIYFTLFTYFAIRVAFVFRWFAFMFDLEKLVSFKPIPVNILLGLNLVSPSPLDRQLETQ